MSDTVNEYGLGSPDTQPGDPAPHDPRPDPLAHGLASRDVRNDDTHGDEDFPEGGRHGRLEHGLAGAGSLVDLPAPPSGPQLDPLRHGLGAADPGPGPHQQH
jgi:hypothetical protein